MQALKQKDAPTDRAGEPVETGYRARDRTSTRRHRETAGDHAENLIFGLGRIAFADPRRLFDADGKLKPVAEWDDDIALAISSVETRETPSGGYVRKVRLSPRVPALEALTRCLGMARNGGAPEGGKGMDAAELRESLKALTPEQRQQLRGICETLAAARRANAEGSTMVDQEKVAEEIAGVAD